MLVVFMILDLGFKERTITAGAVCVDGHGHHKETCVVA